MANRYCVLGAGASCRTRSAAKPRPPSSPRCERRAFLFLFFLTTFEEEADGSLTLSLSGMRFENRARLSPRNAASASARRDL